MSLDPQLCRRLARSSMNPDFFSSLNNPVDFYIIRHGQSEGNASKILQGRKEYPLSEKGRIQSSVRGGALKQVLKGHKTLLFSSPMGRARETAYIIAEEAGLPEPVFSETLVEMDLGIWTGKNWDEARNDKPNLWADFMVRSWDAIPNAETSAELYARSLCFWAEMRDAAAASSAEKIVAVTHGGLIQWLLKCTFRNRSWFPLFPISNCGQFKLNVKPHPKEKSAYMGWEEIDAPIPDQQAEPKGFPS